MKGKIWESYLDLNTVSCKNEEHDIIKIYHEKTHNKKINIIDNQKSKEELVHGLSLFYDKHFIADVVEIPLDEVTSILSKIKLEQLDTSFKS